MKTLSLHALVLSMSSALIFASTALAADVDQIFLRLKAGPQFFSSLDPVSSSVALGIDIGFRAVNGFGVSGVARYGLSGDSTKSDSSGNYTYASATTRFLGVAPTYSVVKGAGTLSFGLGLGSYAISTDARTSANSFHTTTSTSRLAIAPEFQIDIALGAAVALNIGAQYIIALGNSPHYGEFTPMIGLGFQF